MLAKSMDEYMRAMSTVSTDAVIKKQKHQTFLTFPSSTMMGSDLQSCRQTRASLSVSCLNVKSARVKDLRPRGPDVPEEYTVGYVHGSASTGSKLATDTFEEFVQADIDEPRAFLTQHEASQQRVTVDVDEFRQLVDMAQGLDFGDYAIEIGDVPTSLRAKCRKYECV